MHDWQRLLEYLVLRHPETGIKPADLWHLTEAEQWGLYVYLRNREL